MISLENIKYAEQKIKELTKRYEETRWEFRKERIEEEWRILDDKQEMRVMSYLELTEPKVKLLREENQQLLINEHIEFSVTREGWGWMRSHAKQLRGRVHDNGYLYANASKTNIVYYNFQRGMYPLTYTGTVNCLGYTEMNMTKTGYFLFGGKIPEKYVGSINERGVLQMKTTKTYWEHNGSFYVSRIIGDFFSGDNNKRNTFLKNKQQLQAVVSDFRTTILSP